MSTSIRRLIFFAFLFFMVLPTGLIQYEAGRRIQAMLTDQTLRQNRDIAKAVRLQVDEILSESVHMLRMAGDLAASASKEIPASPPGPYRGEGPIPRINNILAAIVKACPEIEMIQIMDDRGTVIHDSTPDARHMGKNMSRRLFFIEAVERPDIVWSPSFIPLGKNSPSITLSRRFDHLIAAVYIDLERFKEVVDLFSARTGRKAVITDIQGAVVAGGGYPVQQRINLRARPWFQDALEASPMTRRIRFIADLKTPEAANLAASGSEDPNMEDLIISTERTDIGDLLIVIERDAGQAFSPIARIRRIHLISLMVSLSLLIPIWIWIYRHILQSIHRLARQAAHAARGRYSEDIEPGRLREFRLLEQAFGAMVHAVRRREKALKEAYRAADTAGRSRNRFFTHMSHELRTPLNAIIGFSEMDRSRIDIPPDVQNHLEIIARSGNHLLTLINQALDMSRMDADSMPVARAPVDPVLLVEDVAAMFRPAAKKEGLYLQIDLGEHLPPAVKTDDVKLRQILINLLGNAIKFCDEGGIRVHADADAMDGHSDVWLYIRVSDTGPGIAPADRERIFEPFSQPQQNETRMDSTGLGLTISREFARLMGGELDVDSRPGEGAVFTLRLRVTPCDPPDRPVCRETPPPVPFHTGYRILVAENHKAGRDLLLSLLRPLGWEVHEAENGREALDLWQKYHPHLIWMDIHMPELNGLEVIRYIRQAETEKRTVIIVLSAFATDRDRESVIRSGADDFLEKPFHSADLFDCMRRHLNIPYVWEQEDNSDLAGMRVMAVDDDPINRRLMREMLTRTGVDAHIASSGREAAAAAMKTSFDLILMDMEMPDMDGYATVKLLHRQLEKPPPVIAVSARNPEDVTTGPTTGLEPQLLSKPVNRSALRRLLRDYHQKAAAEPEICSACAAPSDIPSGSSREPFHANDGLQNINIPGLDMEDGLARLAGDEALYREMIRNYCATYADWPDRIMDCMQKNDLAAAKRLLHRFKGISGNLGAVNLLAGCRWLEEEISRPVSTRAPVDSLRPARDAALHHLRQEMEALCRALKNSRF